MTEVRRRPRGELPVKAPTPKQGWAQCVLGEVFEAQVLGTPVPEGSKVQGFGKSVRNANEGKLKPWRAAIKEVCELATHLEEWSPLDGPLEAKLVFVFTPPKNWDGFTPPHTRSTNDVDKLVRAAFDGLQEGRAVADDARICKLKDVEKFYVGQKGAPLAEPGMYVMVEKHESVRYRSPHR